LSEKGREGGGSVVGGRGEGEGGGRSGSSRRDESEGVRRRVVTRVERGRGERSMRERDDRDRSRQVGRCEERNRRVRRPCERLKTKGRWREVSSTVSLLLLPPSSDKTLKSES